MKLNLSTRRQRLLPAAGFLLSVFLLHQSCTKLDTRHIGTEDPVEKFFTVPAGTEPQVRRVVDNLKEQNKLTGFISTLAQQEGYAVWDKALAGLKPQAAASLSGTSSPDTLLYIPLVPAGAHQVSSFIYARMNGSSMTLKLYRGREYEQFGFDSTNGENAEKIAFSLMMLNNKIWGSKEFQLNDRRLFKAPGVHNISSHNDHRRFKITQTAASAGGSNLHWETGSITHCTYGPVHDCHGCIGACDNCPSCLYDDWTCETTTQYFLVDDTDGDPTGGGGGNPTGGGGGGTPGGSGGGTPSNYPGNNQCTLIQNGELPPSCSGPGHDQGPVTTLDGDNSPSTPDNYNPNQAENVVLDTSISNNFPCVSKILDTLSAYGTDNLNKKAQVAIKAIFGQNTYQTITIKADPTLGAGVDAEIDNSLTTHYTLGNDLTTHYNFTMKVNPAMLATATKEYIAASLVHEAMHAYIDYLFYEYQFGAVDSNEIKSKFPIFWYRTPPIGIGMDAAYQHNQMANNWVGEIKNSLNIFTNNEMTPAQKENVYRALAWGGLANTYVYQTLSLNDRFNIQAINKVARDRFFTGPFTVELLPNHEISPSFNFNASSLKLKNPCD